MLRQSAILHFFQNFESQSAGLAIIHKLRHRAESDEQISRDRNHPDQIWGEQYRGRRLEEVPSEAELGTEENAGKIQREPASVCRTAARHRRSIKSAIFGGSGLAAGELEYRQPSLRRVPGVLISSMSLAEWGSRETIAFRFPPSDDRKTNVFWGPLGASVDVTDALTTRQRVPLL
jgi:hypothetical protein